MVVVVVAVCGDHLRAQVEVGHVVAILRAWKSIMTNRGDSQLHAMPDAGVGDRVTAII